RTLSEQPDDTKFCGLKRQDVFFFHYSLPPLTICLCTEDLLRMSPLPLDQLEQLVQGHHWDPLAFLGAHPMAQNGSPAVAVRCFLPEANDVSLLLNERDRQLIPMTRLHNAGLFEAIVPGPLGGKPYRLHITNHGGQVSERYDPYAFPPLLTD